MLTYRQYLNESVVTKHVAEEDMPYGTMLADTGGYDGELLPKDTIYYLDENGKFHQDNNEPALVMSDGTKNWYKHGTQHRDVGPAVTWSDGDYLYYKDDEVHREDGPAMEINGRKSWHLHNSHISDDSSDEYKWILLKGNPENIKAFPKGANKDMQEYVIRLRPDLIGEIKNLDPEVAERFKYEKELGNVDL
jgi:hypothetical protein